MRRPVLALATVALFLLACGLAGCFNPFDPRVSTLRAASTPAPAPNSPGNVIRLFAWCWQNRDPSLYTEIFTDDYRFVFATGDSAGNAYRDAPWIREYELSAAQHMFSGGTDRPPASDVSITIDKLLAAVPDPRVGKNPKWHKSVRTHVDLRITVDENGSPSVSSVQGYALFFVVRGDSAIIPPELVAKGFKPDSTRWWIERWEDESIAGGAPQAAVRPVPGPTFGRKAGTAVIRPVVPATTYLPPGPVTFGLAKVAWL